MKTPLYPALLCSLALFACDPGTDDMPVEPDTACGDLVCSAGGKADGFDIGTVVLDQSVAWTYVLDFGNETREQIGRVEVRFFGPELPLADGGVLAPNDDSFLQPAVITIDAADIDDPTRMQSLEFLALLQSWDDGETYSIDGVHGQGAFLSSSLPDVVDRFNAVYDFDARTGDRAARVDAKLGFSSVRFARNGGGQLGVERISMVFAERGGDTVRDDKITTGVSQPKASAAEVAKVAALFDTDAPVVAENLGTFSLREGTMQPLFVDDLRQAAAIAEQQSLMARTTVAIFEEGGVFAMAELRFTTSGNRVPMSVIGHYEPENRVESLGPNGPVLLVDHALPHFNLGLADVSAGPAKILTGGLR